MWQKEEHDNIIAEVGLEIQTVNVEPIYQKSRDHVKHSEIVRLRRKGSELRENRLRAGPEQEHDVEGSHDP